MKQFYKILLALVLLLAMAVNAGAMEQKSITRQNSEYASANWVQNEGDIVTQTYLYVEKVNGNTYISLSIQTYNELTGYWSNKYGNMYTQDNVFSISKNFNSACLSEIEMEVYENYYDDMGGWTYNVETITVKADWNGKGEITEDRSKYVSKYGDSTSRTGAASVYRSATATGSINNYRLGEDPYATISSYNSVSKYMEK